MPERRPKRRRYTPSNNETNNGADDDNVKSYADFAMHYQQEQASKQDEPFSFDSMKQPPRNKAQQSVYRQLLHVCMALVVFLVANNCVFLPGSYFANAIDTMHKILTIDNQNSHIYWIAGKIGLAGCGAIRLAEYIKKYNKLGVACPPIYSLIDVDNLPEWVQESLTKRILTALSGFIPSEFPRTIEDVIRMDMTGLSAFLQLFFWSMVHTREQCTILGGAMELCSCLRRIYLTFLESGVTEFLRQEGKVRVNRSTREHEAFNFNGLGLFLNLTKEVNDKVRALYEKVFPEEISKRLLYYKFPLTSFLLAWPVGEKKSCPPKVVNGKLSIVNKIAGIKNWFVDTFKKPPVPNPTTLEQCYKKENYTDDDCDDALGVLDDRARQLEEFQGDVISGFDSNELALSASEDSATLVEYMENRRPCGEDGPRWQVIDEYLKAVVMQLDMGDGHIRILFIFSPFCYAIYWKPGTTVTWEMLRKMKDTIMSAQYVLLNIRILASENCDLTYLDSFKKQYLDDNLLFPWVLLLFLSQFMHLSDDICTLFFKNFVSGENENQFHLDYTNRVKDGFFEIVARNTRRHKTNPNESQEDVAYRADKMINRTIISSISRTRTESQVDERLPETVALFGRDLLEEEEEDAAVDAKTKYTRQNRFAESGLVLRNITGNKLLADIDALYDDDKPNSGNTSENHRSATKNEVVDANNQLSPLVENGGYFWLQHLGVAGMDKDDNSQPMVFPASGTVMGRGAVYKVKDENDRVVKKQIKYLTDPPAPFVSGITFDSARGRFGTKKPAKQKGTAVYYPKHKLLRVKGANIGGAQFVEKANADTPPELLFCEHNLMLCYVEPK